MWFPFEFQNLEVDFPLKQHFDFGGQQGKTRIRTVESCVTTLGLFLVDKAQSFTPSQYEGKCKQTAAILLLATKSPGYAPQDFVFFIPTMLHGNLTVCPL